jgi:hypothetical protein
MVVAMRASGADALPWSWKECTLPHVYEAYEFCLILYAPRNEKSAEGASERGFEGIEKVFAVVGLDCAAQSQPALRGVLLWDLSESPNGAQSRRSSAANGLFFFFFFFFFDSITAHCIIVGNPKKKKLFVPIWQ